MMAAGLRATAKAVEHPPEPKVGAPVLDPTMPYGRLWSQLTKSLLMADRAPLENRQDRDTTGSP